jgi:hypothetical protein
MVARSTGRHCSGQEPWHPSLVGPHQELDCRTVRFVCILHDKHGRAWAHLRDEGVEDRGLQTSRLVGGRCELRQCSVGRATAYRGGCNEPRTLSKASGVRPCPGSTCPRVIRRIERNTWPRKPHAQVGDKNQLPFVPTATLSANRPAVTRSPPSQAIGAQQFCQRCQLR